MAASSSSRWRATAAAMASLSRSQRAVLPSMSVKRKVTVPDGKSGISAPTTRSVLLMADCTTLALLPLSAYPHPLTPSPCALGEGDAVGGLVGVGSRVREEMSALDGHSGWQRRQEVISPPAVWRAHWTRAVRVSEQALMKSPVVQRPPRAGLPVIVPQVAQWRMR